MGLCIQTNIWQWLYLVQMPLFMREQNINFSLLVFHYLSFCVCYSILNVSIILWDDFNKQFCITYKREQTVKWTTQSITLNHQTPEVLAYIGKCLPCLKFDFHGDIQRKMWFNVALLNLIKSLCKYFLLEVKILQFHIL